MPEPMIEPSENDRWLTSSARFVQATVGVLAISVAVLVLSIIGVIVFGGVGDGGSVNVAEGMAVFDGLYVMGSVVS